MKFACNEGVSDTVWYKLPCQVCERGSDIMHQLDSLYLLRNTHEV